jgi:hypothetical protein
MCDIRLKECMYGCGTNGGKRIEAEYGALDMNRRTD